MAMNYIYSHTKKKKHVFCVLPLEKVTENVSGQIFYEKGQM